MSDRPTYQHTQRAPLCLVVYALGITQLVIGWVSRDEPLIRWLFPPLGLVVLVIAASFHHLTVIDQGDRLSIRFGPLPLFRRTIRYADIDHVEVGRTLLLDGWGIHMSIRGGWVWNLWGRDCVVVHHKRGILRIGSDDTANLAAYLKNRSIEVRP